MNCNGMLGATTYPHCASFVILVGFVCEVMCPDTATYPVATFKDMYAVTSMLEKAGGIQTPDASPDDSDVERLADSLAAGG